MNFGAKIRMIRKKKELTQKELSKLAGIHYTMICKYEKGDVMPSIEAMKKMADALDISIDYLMYDEIKDRPETKVHDKELLALFEKADQSLDDKGKYLVKEFVDAMIKKQDLERIMQ